MIAGVADGRLPLKARQFLCYLSVGAASTLVDWGLFYLCVSRFGLHYQAGVAIALGAATTVHFALNKLFTFRCPSPRIARQFLLHTGVSVVYLLCTMASMYVLVDRLHAPALPSRILTTGVMMTLSFTLSRLITFNPAYLS